MKIQISERYTINTDRTHPIIKLISIPLLLLLALAVAGAILFFAWYAYALVKM